MEQDIKYIVKILRDPDGNYRAKVEWKVITNATTETCVTTIDTPVLGPDGLNLIFDRCKKVVSGLETDSSANTGG